MCRSTLATVLVAVFISYLGAPAAVKAGGYIETDLVSNRPGAVIQDPNLLNSWGLVAGPTTPFWVSDNNAGVATLYSVAPGGLTATKVSLTVRIPTCSNPSGGGAPTGVVFNGNGGFDILDSDKVLRSSRFLFATEDGTIIGWNPNQVDRTLAIIAVPDHCASPVNAVYKGLAIATTSSAAPKVSA